MLLHRLFRRKHKHTPIEEQVAHINISIYNDRVEMSMGGDEIRIGGALTTIMLRNPYAYHLISNSVKAVEREFTRQQSKSAYHQLMTFNPN